MISMLSEIIYDFICFSGPARAGSNSSPRRLKSSPDPVQMHPAARPLRLSVLSGLELKLQWFITRMKASWTPALGRHPPIPIPLLGALSVLPPLPQDLDGLVAHHLQGLENDVGVRLTNAICAEIGGPPNVRPMYGVTTIRPAR